MTQTQAHPLFLTGCCTYCGLKVSLKVQPEVKPVSGYLAVRCFACDTHQRDPAEIVLSTDMDALRAYRAAAAMQAEAPRPMPEPARPGELAELARKLRLDASGEAGRMSATDMYRAADIFDQLARIDPRDPSKKCDELLQAVALKFPGESRYDTALRYIREREQQNSGGSSGGTPR